VYVKEDVIGEQDIRGFKKILEWFAGRWGISGNFLRRLEELVGLRHDIRALLTLH
jgi:hypothetical protein